MHWIKDNRIYDVIKVKEVEDEFETPKNKNKKENENLLKFKTNFFHPSHTHRKSSFSFRPPVAICDYT